MFSPLYLLYQCAFTILNSVTVYSCKLMGHNSIHMGEVTLSFRPMEFDIVTL